MSQTELVAHHVLAAFNVNDFVVTLSYGYLLLNLQVYFP
jgi:hypothetical protein